MDSPAADPLAGQRRAARSLATREALLEACTRVMAQHGYGGGSVQEIATAAGLSKNHIFQHFGSKDALVLAALERAVAVWRSDVAQAAQIFPQPPRQMAHAAQALGSLSARGWQGLGCIAALAQSRAALPAALGTAVDSAVDELGSFFRDAFKDARKAGKLGADVKPRQLGVLCVSALLGASAASADPADAVLLLSAALLPGAG